ncbi:MAG: 50S ribosomal protein L15 [Parcubacteria group bacterium]|nr:50S ribosomal protein L15 [Parcubacteria group bacterium]
MPLTLNTISPKKGSRKSKKRIGRGLGSTGRYSGRGIKGQRSRSGGKSGLALKGLRQVMLATPKQKGFKSGRPKAQVVNVSALNKAFKGGVKVTPKLLVQKGLISNITDPVKILGTGSIAITITVSGCNVSEAAKKKIEDAGGSVIISK